MAGEQVEACDLVGVQEMLNEVLEEVPSGQISREEVPEAQASQQSVNEASLPQASGSVSYIFRTSYQPQIIFTAVFGCK